MKKDRQNEENMENNKKEYLSDYNYASGTADHFAFIPRIWGMDTIPECVDE
ncbi:MAG: hypothetical protein ACRDBO_05725 [Lachnospiraceae bacterium]